MTIRPVRPRENGGPVCLRKRNWIPAFAETYLVCLFAFLLFAAPLAAETLQPIPPLSARVTDVTHSLSPAETSQLENKLAAYEQQKGTQIAVLIVPTTQPEAIEPYGIRVAEAWKIGRTKIDDGAILIVALNDHKLRIEVGYGLEGALPDVTAKHIIENRIVPRFKAGDIYGGIDAGVGGIIAALQGQALPAPAAQKLPAMSPGLFFIAAILGGLFFLLLPALFILLAGKALVSNRGLIFALGALALSRNSGFNQGFGGGSSSGGGGFGGGGFSGGGGSFGGGGASGSW